MRFYIASAAKPENWRRRIRSMSDAALVGCVGLHASEASKHLSATLSEVGIPNRWLSLRRRPDLLKHTLAELKWERTPLAHLQSDVQVLILDAEENQLHQLWQYVYAAGLVDKVHFFPSQMIPEPMEAKSPADLSTWAEAAEAFQADMKLAAAWLPCTFIPTLT